MKKRAWTSTVQLPHQNKGHRHAHRPQSIEILLPCEPFGKTSSEIKGEDLYIRFEPSLGPERCPHCGGEQTVHDGLFTPYLDKPLEDEPLSFSPVPAVDIELVSKLKDICSRLLEG